VDTPETIIRHVSLCSGYGGIDIGLRRVLPACRTIAYVEIEAFACANLVAKMEAGELDAAPIWTDLKTLPHEVFQSGVEIISGSFPCQPFSAAGNREADDDPRHLFPFIKNAIRTIQPGWVFLENVEGIISAKIKSDNWADPAGTPVLLHVLRELEREGYQCAWGVFSAAECGAPHQRKRVFILGKKMGDSGGTGLEGELSAGEPCQEGRKEPDGRTASTGRVRSNNELADPDKFGGQQDSEQSQLRASGVEQSPCNRWPSRPGEAQQEWEEPRVVGDAKSGRRESGNGGRAEAEESGAGCKQSAGRIQAKHEAQPLMGRTTPGTASGLDATANRIDRLRLLGNGVVPATCEVAFRTLYAELVAQKSLTNKEKENKNDNNRSK